MTSKLRKAVQQQKKQTKKPDKPITGILGIPINGQKRVEVPGRNGFVYVRLRNDQNEVIQAFNNQVSPAYNLPVLVERQGIRYVVSSVDTQRYESNWDSYSAFVPRHGGQHSFDVENGGGGDIVWVHGRQFMPLLTIPSGSVGANNVLMTSYTLRNPDGTWKFVGNTGTQNLNPYNPTTGSQAVMGIVYLDTVSGNPGFVLNSGTYFPNNITGTAQIVPYLPSITNPNWIPDSAIRLITGTSRITWDNIYDVRQYYGSISTGTSGGGSINTGTLDSLYLRLDASNSPVTGNLGVLITGGTSTALFVEHDSGGNVLDLSQYSAGNTDQDVLSLYRTPGLAGNILTGNMIHGQEDVFPGSISGSFILYERNSVEQFRVNTSGTASSNGVSLIKEAPTDGNSYVRKNAGWEVASSSGGGSGSVSIYNHGNFVAIGTRISFDGNVNISVSGSFVSVYAPITTYFRVGQPIPLEGITGVYWKVPDGVYATGSIGVFQNGHALILGIDYEEQIHVSGTYKYLQTPATGTYHLAHYGVPCYPQAFIPTGVPISLNQLTDSNGTLMTDSNGIQLVDSNG